MSQYHMTLKSRNAKTGPIPVSTTSADSCPDTCPFTDGSCYAKGGPLAIHWGQVSARNRGTDLADFCATIEGLPDGQLWRHNQAGDLPGTNKLIHRGRLNAIVKANRGRRGFTYTHKPLTKNNLAAIRKANDNGFTVNISANNAVQAAKYMLTGLPVVTVLPADAPKHQLVHGVRVVTCPATYRETSCSECQLCQVADRTFIIGFPAHGSKAKAADLIASDLH